MTRRLLTLITLTLALGATAQDRIHYTGTTLSNPNRHDGALSPVVGVHNIQILRANREHPSDANGNGWFVQKLDFVKNADEEMFALHGLDTKHAAVADEKFRSMLEGTPLDSGTVVLKQRTANELTYEISSPKGGLAVLSEVYYPGWTATIDGKPAEVGRVNYILRALKIPAGKHDVVMTFRPTTVTTTEAIAFVAIALIILGFLAALFLTLRKKKSE